MNTEIKFRAKRIDDGSWITGHFFQGPLTAEHPHWGHWGDSGKKRYFIEDNGVAHEIDITTLEWSTDYKKR